MKLSNYLFDNISACPFGPPNRSGVYAVCIRPYNGKKETILYIGSSKNINKRVNAQDHHYRICYDLYDDMLVYTKSIETDDFIEIEKELISIYKPILNKIGKNG